LINSNENTSKQEQSETAYVRSDELLERYVVVNPSICRLSKAISRKRCKIGGELVSIIKKSRIWAFNWYQTC